MNHRYAPLTGAVLAALVLSACSGESASSDPAVAVSAPDTLWQSRAIDRNTLRPEVTLSTGQTVSMSVVDQEGALWSGTVQVVAGSTIDIDVLWVSDMTRGSLALARMVQQVEIGPDGRAVFIESSRYDYDIDSDGDGVSNFDELVAGTNPFPTEQTPADVIVEDTPSDDDVVDTPDTVDPADVPVTTPEPEDAPDANAPVDDADDADDADDDTSDDSTPVDDADDDTSDDSTPVDDSDDDTSDDGTPVDDSDNTPDDDSDAQDDPEPEDSSDENDKDPVVQAAADVFVPRIAQSDAPDIDGEGVTLDANGALSGEWADAVQVDSAGTALGINHLMIDLGAEAPDGTPYRRWGAMHDGEYLYVVVLVDDDGERQSDGPLFWQDDGVELFLDGDYSRESTYGDDDDHHLIIPLLEPGTTRSPNSNSIAGYMPGPFTSEVIPLVDFQTGPGIGPDGIRRTRYEQDVYEIRVELDSVNIEIGRPFGFELQINDDDDGGARDSKWGWAHPSRTEESQDVDFTFVNPSFMGTLYLD